MDSERSEPLGNLSSDYIHDDVSDVHVEFENVIQPQDAPVISSDDESGEVDREYTGAFEGPEKTLEVCFRRADGREPVEGGKIKTGLRLIARSDLDTICKRARCTILSSVSNNYLDAYVLSESSLFVYNYMLILKTCGTTTLLRCLTVIIEAARRLGLELDWCSYSRKNFNFPDDQCFPHGSFQQELGYLHSHRNLCSKLDGQGYTLGPINADHWFVYVADQTVRSSIEDMDTDRVLNIMMFDIDPQVAEIFYFDKYHQSDGDETEEEEIKRISFDQTKKAGIDKLCPGAIFDPRAFQPCGYSMNAILYGSYFTMHITPEEGSSYASFETNQKVSSYTSLINNVVRNFRPKRLVITLMADEGGVKELKHNPLSCAASEAKINVPRKDKNMSNMVYKRQNCTSITVEDDCVCMMGNWIIQDNPVQRTSKDRSMTFA